MVAMVGTRWRRVGGRRSAEECRTVKLRSNRLQFINNTLIMCTRKLVALVLSFAVEGTFISRHLFKPDRDAGHEEHDNQSYIDFCFSANDCCAINRESMRCHSMYCTCVDGLRKGSRPLHRRPFRKQRPIFMYSPHPVCVCVCVSGSAARFAHASNIACVCDWVRLHSSLNKNHWHVTISYNRWKSHDSMI